MGATTLPYGSPQAITLQSAGLFAANMQRNTTMNRLTGKFPQQADAEATIRKQSSNEMPIVRCMDLQKMAGDEITFDLINPMGGKPIMGSRNAEGLGRAMSFSQDRLRINQARYPISAGDTMTQQRTPHELRKLGRALGENYMNRLADQLILTHLAGARGFHDNIEWAVPKASDADFADIAINTVKAPTKNRHFMSTATGIETIKASGSEITIASTDIFNADLVDAVRTTLDSMAVPPPPVIFEGDKMASDSPLRVLLCSSEQYTSFLQSNSGNVRTLQANSMARAQQAGNNPVLMGDALLWNGILIIKMPKPIRFYAGDSLRWCASYTTETETATDLVPAAFSTTHAVDRAILLGGQALAEAWGKHTKSGSPFFFSEKELDHGDKLELLVGAINGRSKIRFEIDHGDSKQFTDYGVIAIDTAVKLPA
ncbi:MAG: N4-gp56 family major capsid protein [Burkholderiaceae bacterium]